VDTILQADPRLATVVNQAEKYRLQVVLGLVEKGPDGRLELRQQGFRLGEEYFYPASSVKLFAAVAALERLDELSRETGFDLGPSLPLVYSPLFEGEALEVDDPSNLDSGAITVRHEARKLFLVSDNQAFNRLYELVGQDGLNRSVQRAGLSSARIVHRLSEWRTEEENRRSPKIDFAGSDGPLYTLPERTSEPLPPKSEIPGLEIGDGFMKGGERVEGPMDFRPKNRISLADLQRGLAMVVRPEVETGGTGFDLTVADRALLLEALHQLPRESQNPVYDPEQYPDNYVKFLLPGLEKVVPREHLRIYNKIGQAYGFTTENAYVVDTANDRAFFLAATLYTNENGILNDDTYEYTTIAEPFLAALGEAVARALWR